MSEWGACAKPRPFTDEDVSRLAAAMSDSDVERWNDQLPPTKLDKRGKPKKTSAGGRKLAAARLELENWLTTERRRILGRLHTLPKLIDPHAGFLPWVVKQGVRNPRDKLLDVLAWWADRRCVA